MAGSSTGPDAKALRIGVFGGAFDPPHRAHRLLAEAAIRDLALDRLLILPTGEAWHKSRPLSLATHRVAMCQMAFGDLHRVLVDEREIRRATPSFTVDTLNELSREHPAARFFLFIGEDQFRAFRTWRDWQSILSLATLVVAARPDSQGMSQLSREAVGDEPKIPHERLVMPLLPVSSTEIREVAASGSTGAPRLSELVPPAVASYISTHSLYQQPS
ncbi:MAG: nicotinate (nicotinamide) nucleotide adenylyltransferase [Hydrogenophaga sp.]|nr:nicotinate (nicotinamide) nucleotide adenylyltransferase [Hydrogenophaga sp.]